MKCPYQISIRAPNIVFGQSHLAVPCGKCMQCKKNEVAMWKIRLTEESKIRIDNSFLTLTYDDNNLPNEGVQKKHIQEFIKNLRYHFSFRYYLISEYGPQTNRPHYHALLFGLDAFSKSKRKTDKNAHQIIEDTWNKGFITLSPVEPQRINYIAEYHILAYDYPTGANANFKLMSSKPAIGANYIDREKRFHQSYKEMYYRNRNFKLSLPRYYKEKIYPKSEIIKGTLINQKKSDLEELNKLMKDKNYYRVRDSKIRNSLEEYKKRKIKNKKL